MLVTDPLCDRHMNIWFLIGVVNLLNNLCLGQFTDHEIRSLRRRAKDADLSDDDIETLNTRISDSLVLRNELITMKQNDPHNKEAIDAMASQLRESYRELVAKTNPLGNRRGMSAAERAIERHKARRALQEAAEEKLRLEMEQLDYIANSRKLVLVDESIQQLRRRGEAYELTEDSTCTLPLPLPSTI